jgi:hypothetical protein
MSEFSDYLEKQILEHTLNIGSGDAWTKHPVKLALASDVNADVGFGETGDTSKEITSSGNNWVSYTRESITFSDVVTDGDSQVAKNDTEVSFDAYNPSGTDNVKNAASVVVTHIGIFTAPTSNDVVPKLLYHTKLNTPKTLTNGDTLNFSVDSITVKLN